MPERWNSEWAGRMETDLAESQCGVALVTGAAGILGPALCEELQSCGWKVAALDLDVGKFSEFEKINGHPHPADGCFCGDLAQRAECFRLMGEVSERLGPVGLLVNNATGQIGPTPGFDDMEESYCEGLLRVDLLAPLYLTQAAKSSLAARRGLVINISSVLVNNLGPGRMMYTAAKSALEKLTESMAMELSPLGIRVNALRVGSIAGDAFLRPALQLLPPDLAGLLREDILSRHLEEVAPASSLTGRVGSASDIGRMIVFLASPAGEFINGAVVPVDGGFSLLQQQEAYGVREGLGLIRRWLGNPKGETRNWLKEKGIGYEI